MLLGGDFSEDLFIERHPTGDAPNECQQLIIKPLSSAQSAALPIKGQPRHKGQIQPGQIQGRTTFGGLANPKPPLDNVAVKISDTAGDVPVGRGIEPGKRDCFAGSEGILHQHPDVQLLRQGRIQEDRLRLPPRRLLFEQSASLRRARSAQRRRHPMQEDADFVAEVCL